MRVPSAQVMVRGEPQVTVSPSTLTESKCHAVCRYTQQAGWPVNFWEFAAIHLPSTGAEELLDCLNVWGFPWVPGVQTEGLTLAYQAFAH